MTQEKSTLECYTDDIAAIVESFADREAGTQALQQLLTSDPQSFCTAAIRILTRTAPSAGTRQLAHLLVESKHALPTLLDLRICSMAEAATASKAIAQTGKKLETALEMSLGKALRGRNDSESSSRILRMLELLSAISAQGWWNSFQMELMAYPDKIVRSKAALLIGRSNKNIAWIGRRLMDRDLRVQANAVEALWELDASESKPLLLAALKSRNNRVAANAALGLYRVQEIKAVRALLDMARHKELSFQLSALWAIGETEDARFLPALAEQFKTANGKLRLAVTKALARIRRREKALGDLGNLRIDVFDAGVRSGGHRSVTFSLSKGGSDDLSGLKPLEVAIWEGRTLVEDYELKSGGNPAIVITGFVAPRWPAADNSQSAAVLEGLRRCLAQKRSGDLWRVDRYALEPTAAAAPDSGQHFSLPYDDSIATEEIKLHHGCIAEASQLERAIATPVPVDLAATDPLGAILRQSEAVGKHAGRRHLVVMIDPASAGSLHDDAALARLKPLLGKHSISLHGICLAEGQSLAAFRAICLSTADGSFDQTSVELLPERLPTIYLQQFNRYQIAYPRESRQDPGTVCLKINCSYGTGQAEIALSVPNPSPS